MLVGNSTPTQEAPLVEPIIEVHALEAPLDAPVDAPAPAPEPSAQKAKESGQSSSSAPDKTASTQEKIVHDVDKDSPEEGEEPDDSDPLE